MKLLVVEDDDDTAGYIAKGLTEAGHVVDRAGTGRDGLFHAIDGGYDCIVMDRMLPQMDGMAAIAAMRAGGVTTPVLILSAMGSPDDRVAGLTSGADDYLTKPFVFAELLARVTLLARRAAPGTPVAETKLTCDDLEMDLLARRVKRGGVGIDLQPREFRLLEYLLRHAGQVVTRTMLLEGVWDYHFDPGSNVTDVHISRLRRKIDDGQARRLLHTVRGSGYKLGIEP
ncbi:MULTISPECIES: response regulator transcription factor [unclassified Sphingomonas]|uniref:winged helix-turn-helix domain-containing protein n=1 Tax=unclassified Sphingomonas TaxID=196159 RepID=UPI0006F98DAD|nr:MULTISPECIES: response regulator transcription factor [unclassified Sphingomonas]KQN03891.1 XRE family transcriptional regulator [Sphingomonas sp. Leaf25]KQN36954.1 XRE family transcriptional regulator [Sphingomonas sp. Leaf42]KQT30381.1 XRE family transcriptional regulator [Sphingomonas sp. Leaf407]